MRNHWGKIHEDQFHLLIWHSLDVAAVAHTLILRSARLKKAFSRLSLSEEALANLMAFMAFLHDFGKLSSTFQHMDSETSKIATQLGVQKLSQGYDVRHDSLGNVLFSDLRKLTQKDSLDAFKYLYLAAVGHHGRPTSIAREGQRIQIDRYFSEEDRAAARVSFEEALAYFRPVFPSHKVAKKLSHLVAGFISISDWIGSNPGWFPYNSNSSLSFDSYFETAKQNAVSAIEEAGILETLERRDFSQLFPGFKPTSVQDAVNRLFESKDEDPYLLIVEETTGGGKTEAALAAAGGTNFYFGLPSMATANGLWRRVESLGGIQTLSHGKRWLMPGSMDRASEWLSDQSRKSLLSEIGVGTIDQAMVSVLHARYNTLRIAGLAAKTLIIDEVHAYDPYMKTILLKVIELHARLGGSVILLSATMPLAFRKEYLDAFAKGRELNLPDIQKTGFPMVTFLNSNGQLFENDDLSSRYEEKSGGRTIQISHLHEKEEVLEAIEKKSISGQCVAWIRNTVDEAIDAYQCLKAPGVEVMLFHSRFVAGDRLDIESRVLERFGKASSLSDRTSGGKGRVLISTQVIEQSLDLDFDFMVTDLCPIDLLLQRAGRLHRHERGDRGTPELLIHCPSMDGEIDQKWVEDWSSGTAFIYPDHGKLWLTLKESGARIRLPADSRRLIDGVYGDPNFDVPEVFMKASIKAVGQEIAHENEAFRSTINIDKAFEHEGINVSDDVTAKTRLGDPTQEWVVFEKGRPVCGSNERSTIQLRTFQLKDSPQAGEKVGKWQKSIDLAEGGAQGWSKKGSVRIQYDAEVGMTFS